jgi:hypothetical protein
MLRVTLALLLCFAVQILDYRTVWAFSGPPPPKANSKFNFELPTGVKNTLTGLKRIALYNPLSEAAGTLYEFFYWFPRKNTLWDRPPNFANSRNFSATDWLTWYQWPRMLPPYRMLGPVGDLGNREAYPEDFFAWGLPGNTLPLGDWDPCECTQVSPKVVKKYRESELKHGRLAMLAVVGCLVQVCMYLNTRHFA